MIPDSAANFVCPACRQERALSEQTHGTVVPAGVVAAIQHNHPGWSAEQVVCRTCVNEGKADEMQAMLTAEMGALSALELEVLDSIRQDNLLSADAEDEFERGRGASERLAHGVVAVVGSWPFAIGILVFIASWLLVNLIGRPFNLYPVVVLAGLSAVLASLAGLQGPIIIMSQRYQRQRDRLRSKDAYCVNLKAELKIQYLTEQVEHVLKNQQALLCEIARMQAEPEAQRDEEASLRAQSIQQRNSE